MKGGWTERHLSAQPGLEAQPPPPTEGRSGARTQPALGLQYWAPWDWVCPKGPFPQHFIMKCFKQVAKLKEFYSEYPSTQHLGSNMNTQPHFLYHVSVGHFTQPPYFFDAFLRNCKHQYTFS